MTNPFTMITDITVPKIDILNIKNRIFPQIKCKYCDEIDVSRIVLRSTQTKEKVETEYVCIYCLFFRMTKNK